MRRRSRLFVVEGDIRRTGRRLATEGLQVRNFRGPGALGVADAGSATHPGRASSRPPRCCAWPYPRPTPARCCAWTAPQVDAGHDPSVPVRRRRRAGRMPAGAAPLAGDRPEAQARRRRAPTKGEKAVDKALKTALRNRGISRRTEASYRKTYRTARLAARPAQGPAARRN